MDKGSRGIIRIYHEFVDRIDNSVPRVTAWFHLALSSDAKQVTRGPIHKHMLDFLIMHTLGASALINLV